MTSRDRIVVSFLFPHRAHFAPYVPGRHRDNEPGKGSAHEGSTDTGLRGQRKDDSKGQHADRAKRSAGGLNRGCHLPAALASEARFAFATDFVVLDQRGGGAKDGRKGEKEATYECSVAAADEAGEDGGAAAERKADQ